VPPSIHNPAHRRHRPSSLTETTTTALIDSSRLSTKPDQTHLGSAHPEVARCLSLTGDLHRLQGAYGRAEQLLLRGLSIQEAALGDARLDMASSLNRLATLYSAQGLYARAEPLYQRSLAIREATLGETHVDVASSLNDLGSLYWEQGQYDRAEQMVRRSLSIREATLGRTHLDVASSLNNLAIIYWSQGQYELAEPLYQRVLAIREAALGRDHLKVSGSLNNLAILYYGQGLYGRAEPLYRRALAINESALGKDHPDVALSLNNLAILYYQQGLYGRAESLHQRALAIRESALGKNHPDVADTLDDLSNIYRAQGLYERAGSIGQRALVIREAALGKDHPAVANSLENLASLYHEQGLYGRAESFNRRALAIRESALGKDHPAVADALSNLADLYQEQGSYGRAEPLRQRALAIRESVLGKDHPATADSLSHLANSYRAQGLNDRAAPLHQRALAIRESVLGREHPAVASSLNSLGDLHVAQHRLADALPLFSRAFTLSEARLRREALGFSESRLASFLQFLSRDEHRLYSLARAHPDGPEVRRLALTAALLFKGRSVEEAADTSHAILQSLGAQDRAVFSRLRELRTQFAKLSLDGPGQLDAEGYRERLKKLADDGDALEVDLAKRSAPLRALAALPSPAEIVERVAAALPGDGALLELVSYTDRPVVPGRGVPGSKLPAGPRYLAIALFPDGHTGAVDLGPAALVDTAALRLRDALASGDASSLVAARKLYHLAFKPLLPFLGKTRRLFLAPDGQLALVPFASLHDSRRFLADTFDFIYLTGGRDLLPRAGGVSDSPSVVVLADPDYGSASPPAVASAERSRSVERFFAEKRAGLSDQRWTPIPGTRQEAESIRQLLPQAQLFLGAAASKEQLFKLASPGILHIATHGFFLEDSTGPTGTRGLAEVGSAFPRLPDPLLRSGLVLAGAGASADPSNSLVTALELVGLNLWGTQLVVLSACDTGRGDVKRGQGVYGLRRALVVAGAETLVVSLWKVDDEATRTMMEGFYRNLLAGQGRAEALNGAMLSLRAQHPHPHFWAPFIALGRDTPLRGLAPP